MSPWDRTMWSSPDVDGSSAPVVSIGVLCYNRRDDLRRTLDVLTHAVDYPALEIIVVDNASTDGTDSMLAAEFPNVTAIRMPQNISVAARNEFYRAARGKYVFSYDDDSFPATPSTIARAVAYLESRPEIAAVSFFCYQPRSNFVETGGLEQFYFDGDAINGYRGLYFVEGGMCIRKDAIDRIAGYDPDFQWGAEGADLTLQMYRLGLQTVYYPILATLHMRSDVHRDDVRNARYFTRNYIWTIAKHFPWYAAIVLTILYIIRRCIAMVLHPNLARGYIGGMFSGLVGWIWQRSKTKKLSMRQVLRLGRWYVFLFRW